MIDAKSAGVLSGLGYELLYESKAGAPVFYIFDNPSGEDPGIENCGYVLSDVMVM